MILSSREIEPRRKPLASLSLLYYKKGTRMKGLMNLVLIAALAGVGLAQSPAKPVGGSDSQNAKVQFAPGTIIRVELVKSVDAKKAKVSDEVIGKTMDDFLGDNNEVLAPSGSKVLAHVAEVTAREGESASTLGIAFDKMVLKNGTEVPLKASIQAIGRPDSNSGTTYEPMGRPGGSGTGSSMPSAGRGGYGGAAPNPGAATPRSRDTTGSASDAGSAIAINGQLTPNAQGVVGMSGVSLTTGAAQDSLLSSQKHNVKLDSGTQMILRVIP